MTNVVISMIFEYLCLGLSFVFFWSTFIVMIGLLKAPKRHPHAERKLKFAVLICARNEENVIRLPVKSVKMSRYPADRRDIIVLADNCTDGTVRRAREAGAIVWEKTTHSSGKGDVLKWGIERVRAQGGYDAIAVFDADNIASDGWFDAMNDALSDGEIVVTGRRCSSNAKANSISGWYTVYWDIMNEMSNRVRSNLGLSAKLTGTGFAFLLSALGEEGWSTQTMVEDVEFTVQTNIRGRRVVYVPEADYADEQPITWRSMWHQLCRWETGGWQVVRMYFRPWLKALCAHPSFRLFDNFFAILTGMSVAFVLVFNILGLLFRLAIGAAGVDAFVLFFGIFGFVFAMSWFTAVASIMLSPDKRRPTVLSVLLFPLFSLVLSASVIFVLFRPARIWKPIPHGQTNVEVQVQ